MFVNALLREAFLRPASVLYHLDFSKLYSLYGTEMQDSESYNVCHMFSVI